MAKPRTFASAVVATWLFFGMAESSLADGFVCTDASASVDWIGVGFDDYNGPCPASASVTDGSGTATAQVDVSTSDTIVFEHAFGLTGPTTFVAGGIESMVTVTFDVAAGGAELEFQSSGPIDGTYSLSGPGIVQVDVPIPGSPLQLSTVGSYELSVHQQYTGGSAVTSPFIGTTSVTLVRPNVSVPVGGVAGVVIGMALATLGAVAVHSRRHGDGTGKLRPGGHS